ncbi:MAG TPA: cytochrome c-type biogenesis protein CcmH [Gaiellaceae bacterium]|nr:cytochrome c-type biogenesis protein CcmH [Gaiellaceae bacterium]
MTARIVICLLLALVLAAPAGAAERPTLARLEHEVMCPTCHTLLELSQAPIADRMRAFIRRRIAAGDSEAEIKRRLVAEFGEGVLAAPPAHGFGLVAWLIPVGGSLAVGATVTVMLRRWRRAREAEPGLGSDGGGVVELDPAIVRRLERELARFDG